jgi:hypothetical protein
MLWVRVRMANVLTERVLGNGIYDEGVNGFAGLNE